MCTSFMSFILSHLFAALIERLLTAGNRMGRLLIQLIRSVRNFCLYLYMFTFYLRFKSLKAIEWIKSSRAENGIRCFMSTKWFQTTWLGPRKVLLNYFSYILIEFISSHFEKKTGYMTFMLADIPSCTGFLKCHCRVHACVSVCV